MKETSPFIVTIATQRSGTKFFGTSISSGSSFHSQGEVFKPEQGGSLFSNYFLEHAKNIDSCLYDSNFVDSLLDGFLCKLNELSSPRFLHFDLMYNNLGAFSSVWTSPALGHDQFALPRWIKRHKGTVVHLVRPSVAESYISHEIAKLTGVYHTGNDVDGVFSQSVSLSCADAIQYMAPVLREREIVRDMFRNYPHYVEITYPDFISGDSVANPIADLILQALNTKGMAIDPSTLFGKSPLKKTSKGKEASVDNYADILAVEKSLLAMMRITQ